jgi:hypothetical protein
MLPVWVLFVVAQAASRAVAIKVKSSRDIFITHQPFYLGFMDSRVRGNDGVELQ